MILLTDKTRSDTRNVFASAPAYVPGNANDDHGRPAREDYSVDMFSDPPPIVSTLTARSRSGTASLCGFSEFDDASTPPRKYRRKTGTGRIDRCVYNVSDCTGVNGSDAIEYDGFAEYAAVDCALADTGAVTVYQDSGVCPAISVLEVQSLAAAMNSAPTGSDAAGWLWTTSPTERVLTGLDVCFNPEGISVAARGTGTNTLTLSVEDTEADAIVRFRAAESYGAWGQADLAVAAREARTSGFSFSYADAQFRVQASDLLASRYYRISVAIYRRSYGVGSFTLYATLEYIEQADGAGAIDLIDDVPNEAGFESYAFAASMIRHL